jgi:hypothetical protein
MHLLKSHWNIKWKLAYHQKIIIIIKLSNISLHTPIVHALAISLSQKWQRTHIGKKNSCNQWNEIECTQRTRLFSLGERVGYWIFVIPMKFPWNSNYLLTRFSIGSQHDPQVPKSSSLYPISFALSFIVETLYNPKEENTTNLFETFKSSILFKKKFGMGQSKVSTTQGKKLNFSGPHN